MVQPALKTDTFSCKNNYAVQKLVSGFSVLLLMLLVSNVLVLVSVVISYHLVPFCHIYEVSVIWQLGPINKES